MYLASDSTVALSKSSFHCSGNGAEAAGGSAKPPLAWPCVLVMVYMDSGSTATVTIPALTGTFFPTYSEPVI